MRYFEITFTNTPCSETINDILSALLADIGFESFVNHNNGIKAYVQQEQFSEPTLKELIETFPIPDVCIKYEINLIEDKNWNEEWEKNFFEPLYIGDNCVIHSTFHTNIPEREYDVLINPQMAFGTGHHATTSLIISELLKADIRNKSLLDMGCGTSILAIVASMRGADPITAIDIDTWCVDNSKDNILLNKIENINVELGNADLLKNKGYFDVIIANINRNILLEDMKVYADHMKEGSELYISGFYVEDIPLLKSEAERIYLNFEYFEEKDNWAMIKFKK